MKKNSGAACAVSSIGALEPEAQKMRYRAQPKQRITKKEKFTFANLAAWA
jgi:hypothetical protein